VTSSSIVETAPTVSEPTEPPPPIATLPIVAVVSPLTLPIETAAPAARRSGWRRRRR